MVVVDFRITTAGAALAAIVCGGGAVVISPKTVEARPVLEHASCVSAGGFTPSPSAWLFDSLRSPLRGCTACSLSPYGRLSDGWLIRCAHPFGATLRAVCLPAVDARQSLPPFHQILSDCPPVRMGIVVKIRPARSRAFPWKTGSGN